MDGIIVVIRSSDGCASSSGVTVLTSILYKSFTIDPVAKGTSAALKEVIFPFPVCVLTPFQSSLDLETRLQHAVGIWRMFDTEKLCITLSYMDFRMIFPFLTAWVVRLIPKPCTANGDLNMA